MPYFLFLLTRPQQHARWWLLCYPEFRDEHKDAKQSSRAAILDKYMSNESTFIVALAGVAQWIECRPANHKGRWFDSQSGHMPGLLAKSPGVGV